MKKEQLYAKFEADISFPDGTVVHPGDVVKKTWMVSNSGNEPWPAGTQVTLN